MIKEEIMDDLRESELGRVMGCVRYTYTSPTHWCKDGICQVTLNYGWMERPDISMNWGSGGVNKGYTEREIAVAMSEAFKMASERLEQLERIVDIAQGKVA